MRLTPGREAELRERAGRNAVHPVDRPFTPEGDLAALLAEVDALRSLVMALAERIAGQSELLTKRAEKAMTHVYDSGPDTLDHINQVWGNLAQCINRLKTRQEQHDRSKLAEPEKSVFDQMTTKLRGSTYGSDEYKGFLAAMKPALDHHYANNSHHPEHYPDGIRGMCLLDVIEMLADWKAATMRHADGDLAKSIEINQKRFGYTDELKAILINTARRLGWLTSG